MTFSRLPPYQWVLAGSLVAVFVFIAYIASSSQLVWERPTPTPTPTPMPMPAPAPAPPEPSEEAIAAYRKGKASCSYLPLKEKRTLPDMGHVCVIIRSYHAHINTTGFPLAALYHCLEQSEYENWSAYVFYVDNVKVYDLHLVGEVRDPKYRSKFHAVDTPYHYGWNMDDAGYTATDFAIYNSCPKDSRWLVVTNGDNDYAPDFFSHLDTQYDAIGFNFFSRVTNPLVQAEVKNITPPALCPDQWRNDCMKNQWVPQLHDLGSVIWNYQRFVRELKSYAKFNPHCCHDGALAEEVLREGWNVKNVTDCLFSHNPNPWSNCMKNQIQKQ